MIMLQILKIEIINTDILRPNTISGTSNINKVLTFSNEENIDSPIVYTDLCRNNTIVMEYINGLMINEISKLKVKGYSLKNIALALSENYIKQIKSYIQIQE